MNNSVSAPRAVCVKRLPADFTTVRFLSSMYKLMFAQVGLVVKNFATSRTRFLHVHRISVPFFPCRDMFNQFFFSLVEICNWSKKET